MTPGDRDQTTGRGQGRNRGSGERPKGVQTEVGSQERVMEAKAVTRTGVKKLLGMCGRDKHAEKNVGAQQRQQDSLPHSLQECEWRDSRVPSRGQMWMEGGASSGRLDRLARLPLSTLARPGIRVWGPRPDRAQSQFSLPGLGLHAQPCPLSWQQAIARATSVAPTPPEQSQALLWETRCAGSLTRLCPLPVQARGRGKEKVDVSGIPVGASGGGVVPLRWN